LAVTIAEETPLQDEVRTLIAALNAYLLSLTPAEFCFHMTAEQMAEPATTLFVARDDTGRAVGMGALRREADGLAEVKRMYTLPEVRGQRVGSRLLDAIVNRARSEGISRLVLETGDRHPEAWRLYERAGFERCGPVLDYPDSQWSVFYQRELEPSESAQ